VVRGEVSSEYVGNFEKGFDQECATFLGVSYELVVEYVNEGLSDHAILQSCFGMGHRPSEGEFYMWNEFKRKRGRNDELSGTLERQKKKHAMLSRSEIQTVFSLSAKLDDFIAEAVSTDDIEFSKVGLGDLHFIGEAIVGRANLGVQSGLSTGIHGNH
jgi:hypothetical protein